MTVLKFKAGDHVMVPMVIESALDGETPYRIMLRDYEKDLGSWVSEEALASATLIEPPLEVGDRVSCRSKSILMTIKAIDGEMAWVEALGDYWTVHLSELRRAEPA